MVRYIVVCVSGFLFVFVRLVKVLYLRIVVLCIGYSKVFWGGLIVYLWFFWVGLVGLVVLRVVYMELLVLSIFRSNGC